MPFPRPAPARCAGERGCAPCTMRCSRGRALPATWPRDATSPSTTRTCSATIRSWTADPARQHHVTDIRPVRPGDREQWQALWAGYLRFYRQRLPPEVTEATFARLIDAHAPLHGLVAERGGALLGFVH